MYTTISAFREWIESTANLPLVAQSSNDVSAIIATRRDGNLGGYSFRAYPAVDAVVIRLWSGTCYRTSIQDFENFIDWIAGQPSSVLSKTPSELPIEATSIFKIDHSKDFYVTSRTNASNLSMIDSDVSSQLSVDNTLSQLVYGDAEIRLSEEGSFGCVSWEGTIIDVVSLDDVLTYGFITGSEGLKYLNRDEADIVVFDGTEKRAHWNCLTKEEE